MADLSFLEIWAKIVKQKLKTGLSTEPSRSENKLGNLGMLAFEKYILLGFLILLLSLSHCAALFCTLLML